MNTEIKIDMSKLASGVANFEKKMQIGLQMYLAAQAVALEGEMKQGAPWTNRSGDARRRLTASVERPAPASFRIKLAHGVRYGVWLELAKEKKYAIIGPVIAEKSAAIFKGLETLVKKL